MPRKQDIGRLALRVEGEWWNAYWAPSAVTMDGAIHLGSIRFNLAQDAKVKQSFMATMQTAFAQAVKDSIGLTPTWGDSETAAEHERAGRA